MNSEGQQGAENKRKPLLALAGGVVLAVFVFAGAFKILSKIKSDQQSSPSGNQEQFVGQAETSQQLQSECQSSAKLIGELESAQEAVDEYKKHVENCREVYFTLEEKSSVRSEGMYPDLIVDISKKLLATDKTQALSLLSYAKTLQAWDFFMGPIVCDSKSVIEAYEESFKSTEEKVCIKPAEFADKVVSELKNKNFGILEKSLSLQNVAWLGSPEADVGCPTKISNIINMAQKATATSTMVSENQARQTETNEHSVVFRANADQDVLMLEFANTDDCLQLKAALVPGLQTNE